MAYKLSGQELDILCTWFANSSGVGGVKIAEAFPEGRGSPHGCGLRARLTRTLPRARPGSRRG